MFTTILGWAGSLLLRGLFSGCSERGHPLVAVHRLLIAVACFSCLGTWALGFAAAVVVALGHRLSSCGTWA